MSRLHVPKMKRKNSTITLVIKFQLVALGFKMYRHVQLFLSGQNAFSSMIQSTIYVLRDICTNYISPPPILHVWIICASIYSSSLSSIQCPIVSFSPFNLPLPPLWRPPLIKLPT